MQRRGRSGSKAKVRADAHDPRGFDAITQGVKSRDKPLVRIVGKDEEPAADGSRALRDEDLVLIRSQLRAAALAESQSEALASNLPFSGMGASPRLMGRTGSSSSLSALAALPPVDLQQEFEIMEAEEFLITADELPEAFGATDVGMLTGLVQDATAGLDLAPFAAALGVNEPFASVLGDDDNLDLAPLTAVAPLTSASVAALGAAPAPLVPVPTVAPTPPSQAVAVAVASVATTPSVEPMPSVADDAAAASAAAGSCPHAEEGAPAASSAASSSSSSQQPQCAASEAQAQDDAALLDACFVAHEAAPPSPTRTPSPASAPDSPPASPDAKRVVSVRREGSADADAMSVVSDGGDEASSEAGSDRTSATADADADVEPSPPSPIEQSLAGKRRAAATQRQPPTSAAVEADTEPAGKRRRRGPPTSVPSN